MKPLCIDLFCGLGGWAEGFIAEGYRVIGFDIERHVYAVPDGLPEADGHKNTKPVAKRGWTQGCAISLGMEGPTKQERTRLLAYPGSLVLQDVLTIHGSQFQHAACIVASPPCQEYSYMAMPWSRAKQIRGGLLEEVPFPEDYAGSRTVAQLNALFNACFRIQREASKAAGRHIPMVVENVKGAQPWVGRARAHFGSFYLWGDVDSVGNRIVRRGDVRFGAPAVQAKSRGAQKFNPDGTAHPQGSWFAVADSKNRGARKNGGGSWFNIAHNTESGVGQNPDGRKVDGFNFHEHEKTGKGRSFQSAAVDQLDGRKVPVYSDPRRNGGKGSHLTSPRENAERLDGTKQGGNWWHDPESMTRRFSSKSDSRKAASAQIAKIPFPLARHIAAIYKPDTAIGTAR